MEGLRANIWHHSTGRSLHFLGCTSGLRAEVEDGLVELPRGAQSVGVGFRVPLTLWPKLPNLREGTDLYLQHLLGMSSPMRQPRGQSV